MILPYIINVALVLAACLAFYKVLLRRETFYKMNRYVLMVCLVISFALPFLSVPEQFSLRKIENDHSAAIQQPAVITTDQTVQQKTNVNSVLQTPSTRAANESVRPGRSDATTKFSFAQLMSWMLWLYWFGVIVFGASFLLQVVLLLYRSWRNPVIIDGQYRIVELSDDTAPCSFGNTIFINPAKYEWETFNQILLHEKTHVRQKHTIDILIAELVLIFQWFNPFAWIYRREIENNLEFLTDDQLMQHKEVDKKAYQLSLVKVSAPNYPLSLTTNYNQSILKKRIAMMNKKRSNLHTAWKYFFLLPLLVFLACLLNKPGHANRNAGSANKNANEETLIGANGEGLINTNIETEGYWFAVIKDDQVNIRFSDEKIDNEDTDFKSGKSFNGTTFKLSELGNIPKGTAGSFNITREAGKMEMQGKFEGNTGMGTYKFVADKAFVDFMSKELKETLEEEDQLAFFFINIRKEYLQMLKNEGFTNITKEDIIPMAAMKIDVAYIKSIRDAGFKDVSMEDLVPLKALNVDGAYIKEIRDAGYKNVTTEQLVSFKSQGIDKAYIIKVRELRGKDNKDDDDDSDDIVSFKAMGIDEAYINSFKAAGINNIPAEDLVAFKAVGVTPEYIKSWHAAGFKNIDPEEYAGMKSQNVTPEYMKSFTDMGYKDIDPENLVAFKALGITPEWILGFEKIGYKNIDPDDLTGLKSQNVTPEFIKSFEAVGFKNIELEEMVGVKVMGVTPEYIKEMKSKGFNYDSLEKYVRLKSID